MPAASIQFFVDSSPCPCIQHDQFKLAAFKGTVEEVLGEQNIGVENIIGNLELASFNPEDAQDWKRFWSEQVDTVQSIANVHPFSLPPPSAEFGV